MADPRPVLAPWETHTRSTPCAACRYTVKGNETNAARLWCDPDHGGCGHFHLGPCPEIEADDGA